jgi:methyltransferase family protein
VKTPDAKRCRLCGGRTALVFRHLVLLRHDVGYHRCEACGSLMTDPPTWLPEAYAIPGVHLDVGIASRTVRNWVAVATLLRRMDVAPGSAGVDFGAATGLFARLMRDVGYDFRAYEPYQSPVFADFFTTSSLEPAPAVITAFEVFEHFADPARELGRVLGVGAPLIVFSTWFFEGQGHDWEYLVPSCGQHVFFYSYPGFQEFAARHGYRVAHAGFLSVAYRPDLLRPAQEEAIGRFAADAAAIVQAAAPEVLGAVLLGSAAIERDAAVAAERLDEQLRRGAGARGLRRVWRRVTGLAR